MTEKKKTKAPARKKSAKAAKARKKAPAKGKPAAKKPTPKAAKNPKRKTPGKAPRKAPQKAPPAPVYEHLFDNPLNVKRVIYGLCAICGILFVLDFFVTRYVDHPWEGLFGFYAIYGFVACVVLVLVAKEMRKVVMRGEDYYDE